MKATTLSTEIPIAVPILQAFRARSISLNMPKDRGRIYIVAFQNYFKLGCSAKLYSRFYDVLRRHDSFAYALIGPEHEKAKELERFILVELNPWLYRDADDDGSEWAFQHTREYFHRNGKLEALLTTWLRSGYSDVTGLKELQDARLARRAVSEFIKRNRRRKG